MRKICLKSGGLTRVVATVTEAGSVVICDTSGHELVTVGGVSAERERDGDKTKDRESRGLPNVSNLGDCLTCVSVHPAKEEILVGTALGSVICMSSLSGSLLGYYAGVPSGSVTCLAHSPLGYAAVGSVGKVGILHCVGGVVKHGYVEMEQTRPNEVMFNVTAPGDDRDTKSDTKGEREEAVGSGAFTTNGPIVAMAGGFGALYASTGTSLYCWSPPCEAYPVVYNETSVSSAWIASPASSTDRAGGKGISDYPSSPGLSLDSGSGLFSQRASSVSASGNSGSSKSTQSMPPRFMVPGPGVCAVSEVSGHVSVYLTGNASVNKTECRIAALPLSPGHLSVVPKLLAVVDSVMPSVVRLYDPLSGRELHAYQGGIRHTCRIERVCIGTDPLSTDRLLLAVVDSSHSLSVTHVRPQSHASPLPLVAVPGIAPDDGIFIEGTDAMALLAKGAVHLHPCPGLSSSLSTLQGTRLTSAPAAVHITGHARLVSALPAVYKNRHAPSSLLRSPAVNVALPSGSTVSVAVPGIALLLLSLASQGEFDKVLRLVRAVDQQALFLVAHLLAVEKGELPTALATAGAMGALDTARSIKLLMDKNPGPELDAQLLVLKGQTSEALAIMMNSGMYKAAGIHLY
ncbi:hypothetical protein KIPB_004618 [Kipferlia bialata]|uniref:IFT80 second beta-propeller domain-containing protein n=1 Tax=Kipferlia bialata TaxID=797122 RepID=A0A9K3CX95_9EUKA|nr:hypothetical protein KIPB_004618 [Kipferlia bialata]|eukprot:g4618.t1